MSNLFSRTFSLLVSLLFFVSAIFVYSFLIKDSMDDVINLRASLISKNNIIKTQSVAIKKVNDLITKYHSMSDVESSVNLSLPNNEDLGNVIHQLSYIASNSNIDISNINFKNLASKKVSKNKNSSNLGSIEASVRVVGGYEGIRSFIEKVESNIRIMDVKSFTLAKQSIDKKSSSLAGNIIINLYYQE